MTFNYFFVAAVLLLCGCNLYRIFMPRGGGVVTRTGPGVGILAAEQYERILKRRESIQKIRHSFRQENAR